mmetsp:Transcript_24524/g.45365  ORF Transcript_24524/g.45365 Transcript_24524/m.45365 type:complete len:365 (-) Transcript_24524:225-1319(-)|eukprot:CAMPEP_0197458550 /NCGR_PEP_ID=MMETSP1175-20131217/48996_1 /TAXON_ID=1003142 /ORGANISM="Triceratium dubium, Strain CCMP147" /LENGTH=364 /DNA_ID=CAMNT_0042993217 /DNA_START=289 /DNA_END=1383 /DNA_ORIENTATION=+
MALTVPPELKKITTFIRRAEELDKDKSNPESRVVAYYCRQHAVQVGIPLATSGPGKKCLGELLGQLETEKQAMSVFSREESKLICRRFADRIFQKADNEDRAGRADKGTARTFYAAASFFEILQQFYAKTEGDEKTPEEEEEAEKRVYCKWKATEILKAIREGRKPTPGGYGDEMEGSSSDEKKEDTEATGAVAEVQSGETDPPVAPQFETGAPDIFVPPPPTSPGQPATDETNGDEGTECGLNGPHDGAPPAYPDNDGGDVEPPPPYRPPPTSVTPDDEIPPPPMPAPTYNPHPPAPKPKPTSASLSTLLGIGKKSSRSVGNVSKAALADATELTRFALAALESKDSDLAAERLQQALTALGR